MQLATDVTTLQAVQALFALNRECKALDNVAAQTPVIRQEQEEKQADVDKIEGSDTRLPDGYGDSLQRLRERERRNP